MSTAKKALESWAKEARKLLPQDVQNLIYQTSRDLYDGPSANEGTEYPGFLTACKRIREAADEILSDSEFAIDEDGMAVDPEEEEGYRFSRQEFRAALVGKNVARYL